MRTTIDQAGRIVVPKALRDQLRLAAGAQVEVSALDGCIEITPVTADVTVSETAEGPVAEPVGTLPPLTDDDVRTTVEALRR